jgi:hypothetical protein
MWYRTLLVLILSFQGCSAAQQQPPESLLIDGFTWKIHYVKSLGYLQNDRKNPLPYLGNTLCGSHLIEIVKDQNETDIYEVLVHEIQHAMTCDGASVHNEKFNNLENKAQKEDDYHSGIYWATPHWIQFIQDNPAFIRRLQELKPPLVPEPPPPYF